jgi:hypothetical protein
MARKREWKEAEIVLTFNLERITTYQTPLMKEWLNVEAPIFTQYEQQTFDILYLKAVEKIAGWSEEDLKMKFLSFLLELGHLSDDGNIVTFFDKKLTGQVEGINLSVKSDFMLAKGFMNIYHTPYFHFQEYKPQINPTGEPMAQLLEAFLIAIEHNKKDGFEIPLYGCEIIGGTWRFITMEKKQYCISNFYDCTNREDLLKIVSILRNFKRMLVERCL